MNDSPGWATPGSPSDDRRPEGDRPAAPPTAPPTADGKWSAAQPPPGQWSSPAEGRTPPEAPAPRQQTGWGSYDSGPPQQPGTPYGAPYAHPGGWGGPPAAAKPGVIPLRPLGLGEILDGAVSTLRGHWRPVLSISLVVAALSQIALLFVQRATMGSAVITTDRTPSAEETSRLLGDTALLYGAEYYLEILGLFLVTALLAPVVSHAVLGRSSTLPATLRTVRPLAPRLAGLIALLLLGALAAAVLPVLPGILAGSAGLAVLGVPVSMVLLAWFYVTFVLAPPALVLERGSVTASLKRSAKLVRGSWWRIFGISLLTWLLRGITSGIIVMPFAAVALFLTPGGFGSLLDGSAEMGWSFLIITAIGSVVAATVTLPMQTGVTTLLYVDQRIRREALDLELARAAGQDGGGPVTGG
ncbi:membrane protein [Streptomyces roseochromogenus]|nr:membrane protein [Streptomyces roseochromogenus]